MGLKDSRVSMVGQDGQTYEVAVEASSLFDAADRAPAMGKAVVVSPGCRSSSGWAINTGK
jgi:hypothetical protein